MTLAPCVRSKWLRCFAWTLYVPALAFALAKSASAATTGTITGTVVDAESRAPIAGASVTAASPSQVARVTTDAVGTVHLSFAGARHVHDLRAAHGLRLRLDRRHLRLCRSDADARRSRCSGRIKEIARVTSRSPLSPVRPGTGTDVYSVKPAVTARPRRSAAAAD